jgi:hypothetical protein
MTAIAKRESDLRIIIFLLLLRTGAAGCSGLVSIGSRLNKRRRGADFL